MQQETSIPAPADVRVFSHRSGRYQAGRRVRLTGFGTVP